MANSEAKGNDGSDSDRPTLSKDTKTDNTTFTYHTGQMLSFSWAMFIAVKYDAGQI